MEVTYGDGGVSRGDGEDVGAGDGPRADCLDLRLDAVHDVEASQRAPVGERTLLPGEVGRVGKQHRPVASLSSQHKVADERVGSEEEKIVAMQKSEDKGREVLPERSSRGSGA